MVKQMLIVPFAALALAAGVALAHSPADSGSASAAGWSKTHNAGAELAELKARLEITPAQEGAWNNFAQAMTAMHRHEPMHEAAAETTAHPLPAPQVFSMMAKHAREFAVKSEKLSRSADALYKELTQTQRTTFDMYLAQAHARMHERHHHWQKMPPTMKPGGAATSGAQ